MKESSTRPLELEYDHNEGHFIFSLFNRKMLGDRVVARIGKEKALVTKMNSSMGQDDFGVYEEFSLHFVSPKNGEKRFNGMIKIYDEFVVFEISALFEIKGKKKKDLFDHPYIAFPCFEGEFRDEGCTMLSFKRQVPFNYPIIWKGKVTDSLREGKNSPLLMTDKRYQTIILSPLTNLLYGTVSISSLSSSVRCGIPRALKSIPNGTLHRTIMVYGKGVNSTIDRWGEILRKYYGIEAVKKDADVLLTYISYWTNAGSAYWYNTYKKKDYENTLKKLRTHHEAVGLSFGSYQLDSWWYKKDGDHYTSGITEWKPEKVQNSKNFNSMFPFLQRYRQLSLFTKDKMSYVQSLLHKPIGCHFKQLSNKAVYVRKNKEDFICEEFPMPKNKKVAKRLFRELFKHPKWRLAYIVHDWLQWMNDRHSAFNDFLIGSAYFEALDEVCREIPASDNACNHLTIQFCMTQPHITLYSVTMASVTSIRSTSDSDSFFVEGTKRWWWHLYSSRFIQALGKYAFYDNRMTSKSYTHPLSPYSKFEMIWLGLSCGPIGIGDPIGKENIDLIQRVVKDNGEIIKPDVPAVPLDQCYLDNPYTLQSERGVTVYSHSALDDREGKPYTVYYLLTFNVHPFGRKVHMDFQLEEVGAEGNQMYALYDYFNDEVHVVSALSMNTFVMQRRRFYYHIAAPIKRGIAFLGNRSKHVACSRQLVHEVSFTDDSVIIKVYSERRLLGGNAIMNKQKKQPKSKAHWIFYCQIKPKTVLVDGTPVEIIWKDAILKIKEGFESMQVKDIQEIKIII